MSAGSEGRSMLQRWGVAIAALVVAAALAGFMGFKAQEAPNLADAQADALAAAKERVPTLLSYDTASLDADLKTAVDQTTGPFSDDYAKILKDVVGPTARKQKISTSAVVSAAGVVSGTEDRVTVLVFLTQTTEAGKAGKAGRSVTGSRIEVTMTKTGDDWKISGYTPV